MHDKEFNEKYIVYIINHLEMIHTFGKTEQKNIYSQLHARFKYEVLGNDIIPRVIKIVKGGLIFTAVLVKSKTPFYKYEVKWKSEKKGWFDRVLDRFK